MNKKETYNTPDQNDARQRKIKRIYLVTATTAALAFSVYNFVAFGGKALYLLLCPEDGARGLFRYLLFFFFLPKTAMAKTAPPITRIRMIHNAGLLVWLSCAMVS